MTEFVNPYHFVHSGYNQDKTERPCTHEQFYIDRYSGKLTCSLKTVSRVITKGFESGCIFGSSLKGMVRSVAETVSQGCCAVGGSKCRDVNRLCICCRIFGWLNKEGSVFAGRCHINDAEPQGDDCFESVYIQQHALSVPKPGHTIIYPSGGRKFYYHHDPNKPEQKTSSKRQANSDIHFRAAKANRKFSFQVEFTDLSGPELGLLLYALQLEDDWYHKLGQGKPLGFGTVKITVESISLLPADRYEIWDVQATSLEMEQRDEFIKLQREAFFQHQFSLPHQQADTLPHWRDFRHMLIQHNDYNIQYPSQKWFKAHGKTQLPTMEEIEGNPPGDRSKWLKE